LSSSWDCQQFQVTAVLPSGPGQIAGCVSTAFDPVAQGVLAPIGRLIFASATSGCLDIIESCDPFGTGVTGCDLQATTTTPENWGRVCVGPGGYDACDPYQSTPVEPVTWGQVKAQYR
jgi:hypothetical protein